ncbi:CDP-diacylglycerol--serine O-phosphatidyltransferase [Parabacteroides pacaensis]|uniref:CDP-diacylglycerol--serine O-phosphatidyltransferase n=1 Tax=Parabacteroides pacaensis TaxID=2086575 RepID=UPI000D1050ED|nr:CDP-diacylglycerol--serine O-phosphatidyltransferase [Parabacteroides pacaensis]
MNITKHLPNTLTCLSLISGCVACTLALQGQLYYAAVFVIVAAVFDFCDGFAARMLHAYSLLGKELDSLGDMVSFGVAPGMVLFQTLSLAAPELPWGKVALYIPYLAFIIPTFSGLRLAKFNIDTRQTTSFLGLPVPANALFWVSVCYATQLLIPENVILYTIVVVIVAIITSFLLVSEIPMFSLKIKSLAWKGNELRYLLVAGGILFIVLWGFLGIAGTIVLYIFLSLLDKKK